jgi:hypothetical protein
MQWPQTLVRCAPNTLAGHWRLSNPIELHVLGIHRIWVSELGGWRESTSELNQPRKTVQPDQVELYWVNAIPKCSEFIVTIILIDLRILKSLLSTIFPALTPYSPSKAAL